MQEQAMRVMLGRMTVALRPPCDQEVVNSAADLTIQELHGMPRDDLEDLAYDLVTFFASTWVAAEAVYGVPAMEKVIDRPPMGTFYTERNENGD